MLMSSPRYPRLSEFIAVVVAAGLLLLVSAARAEDYFEIQVVDSATGRGVPMVELTTVDNVTRVTDNAGRVAYFEPEHDGRQIFFRVRSHGYAAKKDGFGMEGVRLTVKAGGRAQIPVRRINIAERLYRATGQGLYRDSILLGRKSPLAFPLGVAKVSGQDSVQSVIYRGKVRWFWGDTNRLSYPLGLFRTAGATSLLPSDGGLAPSEGIDYSYFTRPDGFARAMADIPDRKGVVWIDGVCVVRDKDEKERMVAHFSRRPGLAKAYEQGVVIYNDERDVFEVGNNVPLESHWQFPYGHPILVTEDGVDYLVSGNPFPLTRVRATLESVLDPTQYESWSCLNDAFSEEAKDGPDRNADGEVEWRWRKQPPVGPKRERAWLAAGLLQADETQRLPFDVENPTRRVLIHSGSVRWNAHRKRWIMIAMEFAMNAQSPSLLGEVWYSEAESPQGPYRKAIRVLTHRKQSFYNPCHHAFLDEEGGRFIYFDGTYTNMFTNSPATPRYNYNQIMHRLDLDDERLREAFPEGRPISKTE